MLRLPLPSYNLNPNQKKYDSIYPDIEKFRPIKKPQHPSKLPKILEQGKESIKITALYSMGACSRINSIATYTTKRTIDLCSQAFKKIPYRTKSRLAIAALILDQVRMSYVVHKNEKKISKNLLKLEELYLPKNTALIGYHCSRKTTPITLNPYENLYLAQVNSNSSNQEKIIEATYTLFYTQGIGKLYMVTCDKEDEKQVREMIKTCVEDYITGESTNKIKLIEIPIEQAPPGPMSFIRGLWQKTATMMHEGYIVL